MVHIWSQMQTPPSKIHQHMFISSSNLSDEDIMPPEVALASGSTQLDSVKGYGIYYSSYELSHSLCLPLNFSDSQVSRA